MLDGRTCRPQTLPPSSSSAASPATYWSNINATPKSRTQDRISQLEREVSSLVGLVRDKPSSASRNGPAEDSDASTSDEEGPVENNDDNPAHLRLLFEHLAPDGNDGHDIADRRHMHAKSQRAQSKARAKLVQLLPTQVEISRISPFAEPWMILYYSLFPAFYAPRWAKQMAASYHHMHEPETHPALIGTYLLIVAITCQQVTSADLLPSICRERDLASYVKTVCECVERTVLDDSTVLGTVEGLECALLFVRLYVSPLDSMRYH